MFFFCHEISQLGKNISKMRKKTKKQKLCDFYENLTFFEIKLI
jgi:hypothetical protein